MAERYTRVFSLQEQLYCPGSPVVIVAGALLKDGQNGRIIAQLKFKNISKKTIRALTIKVLAKDVTGADVEGVSSFQYLDLDVPRDGEFGSKTPIVLPNTAIRTFSCECKFVLFDDGTSWSHADDAKWGVLPAPTLLKTEIGAGLVAQYQRNTKRDVVYKVADMHDLWYCGCGAVNCADENICHKCHIKKSALYAALNLDTLTESKKLFDEAEATRRAENEEREKNQSAKRKKVIITATAIACVAVALIVLTTTVIIPSVKYNSAVSMMEKSNYVEAIAVFEAIGGYKDSEEKISECKTAILNDQYNNAIALMKAGEYDQAIACFESLKRYQDSAAKATECGYLKATALMEAGEYDQAIACFESLKGYQDSGLQAMECKYLKATTLMKAGDNTEALALFAGLGNYKDSAKKGALLAFDGPWKWLFPMHINPNESYEINVEDLTVAYVWAGTSLSPKSTQLHSFKIINATTIVANGLRSSETTLVTLQLDADGKIKVSYPEGAPKPSSNEAYLYLIRAQ